MVEGKRYNMTPNRAQAVKRIARRNYVSFSQTVVKLHCGKIIRSLGNIIKDEMKKICSDEHSSILHGDAETIQTFSWSAVWDEVQQHVPTLVSLLTSIIPAKNEMFLCTIISMVLKQRSQRMGLLQKVISALFYANGVHKQVTD